MSNQVRVVHAGDRGLLVRAKVMDKEFCGTFDVPACRCPGEIYDLRVPIVDCDTGRIMVDLRCRRCGKVYGVEAQR